MAYKQTHTIPLPPLARAGTGTSASIQMIGERLDNSLVHRCDRRTLSSRPMDKMFGRSKMAASCYLCIARLVQLLRKRFKQAAIRAVAQFLNT